MKLAAQVVAVLALVLVAPLGAYGIRHRVFCDACRQLRALRANHQP